MPISSGRLRFELPVLEDVEVAEQDLGVAHDELARDDARNARARRLLDVLGDADDLCPDSPCPPCRRASAERRARLPTVIWAPVSISAITLIGPTIADTRMPCAGGT